MTVMGLLYINSVHNGNPLNMFSYTSFIGYTFIYALEKTYNMRHKVILHIGTLIMGYYS